VALLTQIVAEAIEERGFELASDNFFDTIVVNVDDIRPFREKAERQQINLRYINNKQIGISLDETVELDDLFDLDQLF
jgi:glycine dehydrogenase